MLPVKDLLPEIVWLSDVVIKVSGVIFIRSTALDVVFKTANFCSDEIVVSELTPERIIELLNVLLFVKVLLVLKVGILIISPVNPFKLDTPLLPPPPETDIFTSPVCPFTDLTLASV